MMPYIKTVVKVRPSTTITWQPTYTTEELAVVNAVKTARRAAAGYVAEVAVQSPDRLTMTWECTWETKAHYDAFVAAQSANIDAILAIRGVHETAHGIVVTRSFENT